VSDLLKSVSAFRADKVAPHSGGCDAQAVLVVCTLTLVADDQRSASRDMISNFTVIVSGDPPKLKQRFKGLVACLDSGDHVLAYQWVDIPMKVVLDQGESQVSGGKPIRMTRGGTFSSLGVSSGVER
jgi:hypothetical protein